mmetsp:Transcript_21181/g.39825  ORF Transcript_21181/g.39825 Transcript_21181/m.39825 type:complete len:302 (+) Transcript_21181:105-1010(+)
MGSSLLLASVVFALLGSCWMMVVLAWQYPWLLHLLFFMVSTMSFFGLAGLCLVLYFIQLAYESDKGALQLLPPAAGQTLSLSIFEIVEVVSSAIMRPLYDCIRVLLLVNVDLDEETRKEILEEMSPEFRRRVFQQSLGQLLPRRLQRIVMGRVSDKPPVINFDPAQNAQASSQLGEREKERKVRSLSRSQSLADLLEFLRTVDGSHASSRQSSVVQKILASKMADGAIWTMSQGAVHQYESHLSQRVRTFLENVSKEPENRLLRVPWQIVNWELSAARSVLRGMVSLFDSPQENVANKKEN